MANTLDGFVVIQVGDGSFTLTPKDVENAAASFSPKNALKNLQVEYLSDNFEDAVQIGTLGDAAKHLSAAFGALFGASSAPNPLSEIGGVFESLKTAIPGLTSDLQQVLENLKTAISSAMVKITRITIDVPKKKFTFGIAIEIAASAWPDNFPIKLKVLAITFDHQG